MAEDDDAIEVARQRRIADACLGDGALASGRLGLYRHLVHGNLTRVARRLLPRTAAVLDRHDGQHFDAWFARFLAEAGPRTPYLRDVAVEFVAWAAPRWETEREVGRLASDVARHEVDLFLVEAAPSPLSPSSLTDISLDRRVVFASPRKLAHYRYAVHELDEAPREQTTTLLIHRDEENTVHATLVPGHRNELLALLLDGAPLGEALTRTVTEDRVAVAEWLAELGVVGVLLGGAAD